MRKLFIDFLHAEMKKNEKIYFLTADIGFGIVTSIMNDFPDRFKNVGSSEQLMIGMAIGLYYEGYLPICYTITPFLIYRPFEQIRNYVDYDANSAKVFALKRNRVREKSNEFLNLRFDLSHTNFDFPSLDRIKLV
jgi:transketolase